MRLTSIIIASVASAAAVYAAAGTVCRDTGFQSCYDLSFPGNFKCVNLGNEEDKISSFAITPGYACRFLDNRNCDESQGVLDNQRGSVGDLRDIGWNDRISSYLCTLV